MGRTAEELGTAKIDYIYVNMFGDTFLAPGTNTKNCFAVLDPDMQHLVTLSSLSTLLC